MGDFCSIDLSFLFSTVHVVVTFFLVVSVDVIDLEDDDEFDDTVEDKSSLSSSSSYLRLLCVLITLFVVSDVFVVFRRFSSARTIISCTNLCAVILSPERNFPTGIFFCDVSESSLAIR